MSNSDRSLDAVTVRPYRASDAPACRTLWAELTEHHRELYDDSSIGGAEPGGALSDHLARPDLVGLWVAERQGNVLGMAGLLLSGEEAEIEPIVVAREQQGKGIGRMLLARAVSEAQARGVRFLNVRPVARNTQAISFFAEAGFNLLGRIELFQGLDPRSRREWKAGIEIHGIALRY